MNSNPSLSLFETPLNSTPVSDVSAATVASRGFAPLAPRALYQQVAERLREQIFSRQLEPGSWIDEMKLCAEYGISRTPLREALKVLSVEGLVTIKVRRGAYVTEMSKQDVTQVYHLLSLLESDAAAQVASSASAADRARLNALHEQLEREVHQRDAFFATNEAFHMALLDIAGNRWAQQVVKEFRARVDDYLLSMELAAERFARHLLTLRR